MMRIDPSHILELRSGVDAFLDLHRVRSAPTGGLLWGEYSLLEGAAEPDLYGTADAVYTLHTVGALSGGTDRTSRDRWASQILECQDDQGWFTRRNVRGHPREHATAYAIGALRLLEVEPSEVYVERIRPMTALFPLLTDEKALGRWLTRLGFRPTPRGILSKDLGWHYIWRGSHVAGGVAAALAMTRELIGQWWPGEVDLTSWFTRYFDWLDAHVNPDTGFWQRGFWNAFYRRPTVIDLGGAAHFYWIYEALGRPLRNPESIITSTIALQRDDGLYKDRPLCIDLDAAFGIVRAYRGLPESQRRSLAGRVYRTAERNFEAIVRRLSVPLKDIYSNSHDLPGALAALVEWTGLPGFAYAELLRDWQNPLDRVPWL